jgi:hypothetical protein
MTLEEPAAMERELSGLSREIRQEVFATAGKVRRLQRMISAATAVPILLLLGWPVMAPSLVSLLVRVGRLAASSELRGPLRWAARLPAQHRPPAGARGVVADLVVLGRARRVLWAGVIVPPVVAACMGAVLYWGLRAL